MHRLSELARALKADTHVYIIKEYHDRYGVKIGISQNPDRRLDEFGAGNPNFLILAHVSPPLTRRQALAVERRCHEKLSKWCIGREWFDCGLDLALATIRQEMGIPANDPGDVI